MLFCILLESDLALESRYPADIADITSVPHILQWKNKPITPVISEFHSFAVKCILAENIF